MCSSKEVPSNWTSRHVQWRFQRCVYQGWCPDIILILLYNTIYTTCDIKLNEMVTIYRYQRVKDKANLENFENWLFIYFFNPYRFKYQKLRMSVGPSLQSMMQPVSHHNLWQVTYDQRRGHKSWTKPIGNG